jgi:hypothetical protein
LNKILALLVFTIFLAFATPCYAVHWISSQTGPSTWTYTLQIDPLDNFNISQSSTTITMTGRTGVTSATGPTSSDFPQPFGSSASVLGWTPQVLNGGTKVVWTINGGGTGNFSTVQKIFGFSITAPGASNGTASFVTNGFQVDSNGPIRDISGSVAAPSTTAPPPTTPVVGAPAATTFTLVLMSLGLALAGSYAVKRRRGQTS